MKNKRVYFVELLINGKWQRDGEGYASKSAAKDFRDLMSVYVHTPAMPHVPSDVRIVEDATISTVVG